MLPSRWFQDSLAFLCLLGLFAFAPQANAADPAPDELPATVDESADKPASIESDKDLARYVRTLKRRFKKDDGYYVLRFVEMGVVAEPTVNQNDSEGKVNYQPYATVSFEVLSGRDAAVERVVGYLADHNPPWQKRSSSRAKTTNVNQKAPTPRRDWQFVRWFPESEEGSQMAQEFTTRAQQAHDAQVQAEADRNKPKCAKCAKAAQ